MRVDITERLRTGRNTGWGDDDVYEAAASEIDRLRAELAKSVRCSITPEKFTEEMRGCWDGDPECDHRSADELMCRLLREFIDAIPEQQHGRRITTQQLPTSHTEPLEPGEHPKQREPSATPQEPPQESTEAFELKPTPSLPPGLFAAIQGCVTLDELESVRQQIVDGVYKCDTEEQDAAARAAVEKRRGELEESKTKKGRK